ncbi:MAG: hypothetical protein DRQ59_01280 [Gammaproteobacteria bacterium]|nr:MAG: hypothetical protein DRQ59_01280 [Gammaproteobacteria bacterium]
MVQHTRVAVIGGGVTGCSILYHLARVGWTDITLIERSELTSGSTWHAAGNLFTLTTPSNAQRLHLYTLELYETLERETGQSIGYHPTGGLHLAASSEEIDTLTVLRAQGRRNGIETDWMDLAEVKRIAPIVDTSTLKAVLWEPGKGHIDPSSVTNALANAARACGATILRHCPVTAMRQQANGGWRLETDKGVIEADIVVNAAGLWAREVAALAGIRLPLAPVEHQYLVTESIPEIMELEQELPTISEGEYGFYSRQEGDGLLLGAYEDECRHWALDGTPLDFGHELLQDDISRLEEKLAAVCKRMPPLENAGIKRVVNGPIMFSPDLGPLIGPHPDLKNYFCAVGVMTGFNQAGGIGKVLSEWIIEGEPELDVSFWDVARFESWAGRRYTFERTKYYYEHRDEWPYPHRECPAGREARTFPTYDLQQSLGAVFGVSSGWETPLWYPKEDDSPYDIYSWRRQNWFRTVGDECRTVRQTAGLFEISTFAKYRVTGAKAEAALDRLLAGRLPRESGRMALCPMLSPRGRLIGDFSVGRLANDSFLLFGSGAMHGIHLRWFQQELAGQGVQLDDLTSDWAGLMVCGPNAAAIVGEAMAEGPKPAAMPFMSLAHADFHAAPQAIVARLSFTGESGFEIYTPMAFHRSLFADLLHRGAGFDLRPVGGRALMELRLEKSFPAWGLDLSADYGPAETGLSRFVDWDKADFIGKQAALVVRNEGPREILTTLVVDAKDVDCAGGEPVFQSGEYIGYVSSGGFGHTVNESIALAYLPPDSVIDGANFDVEILGERRSARLSTRPRFDPEGKRMRS